MHRGPLLVLIALALLAGCGTFVIDAGDIKGFSPSSQVWQVESNSAANRHSFVLTSISGYCSKKRLAEQARIDADARHATRLEEGTAVCESEDLRLDDLADAYDALERDGAAFLFVTIDREEEASLDARTVPEAGEYHQVGAPVDGRFTASYLRFNGKVSRDRADAYTCLESGDIDESNWQEFMAEEEPGLQDSWDLDAGILTVEASGDESWSVDVDGDLLEGGSTVGDVEARFDAERCEVPMEAGVE